MPDTATRILVFGNSGSGKSTLAKRLDEQLGLAHLDLDTLAWLPDMPPRRRAVSDSAIAIREFTAVRQNWVIEGCYADLLQLLAEEATDMVYLRPGEEECVANARKRPFEPEKYSSEEAQNGNLAMLIDWINDYPNRQDSCSLSAHENLFDSFGGGKHLISSLKDAQSWMPGQHAVS